MSTIVNNYYVMSQTRPKRIAMKRNLSVDNLNTTSQSQSPSVSTENLTAGKKSGGFVVVNSKRRRKQKQTDHSQPSESQLSEFPADVNNDCETVLGGETVASPSATNPDDNSNLLDTYIKEIDALKVTVINLQSQLNFVLSFLGIADDINSQTIGSRDIVALNSVLQTSSSINTSTTVSSVVQHPLPVDVTVNNQHSQSTLSHSRAVKNPSPNISFKNAVISAVYADFEEKDRRAKNIVISGLSTSSESDKSLVEKLCLTEFDFMPAIAKCRRLGQPRSDRTQPILVVFQSVADAEYLVKNAKSLRLSSDPQVRSSVYINADLTKAEALTAYQRRCRRRALAAERNSSIQSTSAASSNVQSSFDHRNITTENDSVSQSITVINTRVPSNDSQTVVTSAVTSAVTEHQLSVDNDISLTVNAQSIGDCGDDVNSM